MTAEERVAAGGPTEACVPAAPAPAGETAAAAASR